MTTRKPAPEARRNGSRVQQALRLYARLLDRRIDEDGVKVHIARVNALLDDMTERELGAYYAGAQRERLARREAGDATP